MTFDFFGALRLDLHTKERCPSCGCDTDLYGCFCERALMPETGYVDLHATFKVVQDEIKTLEHVLKNGLDPSNCKRHLAEAIEAHQRAIVHAQVPQ